MAPESPVIPATPAVRWTALLLCAGFLAINFAICTRSPTIWIDEVRLNIPGINLGQGRGLIADAAGIFDGKFYGGHGFLHQLAVAVWTNLFGTGIVAVRSLNYVIALVVAWLLADSLRAHELLRDPWHRLGASMIFLSSYGISFDYRSARPDMMMLLCALMAFRASAIHSASKRYLALAGAGILLSLSGFQVVFAMAVFCGLLLLFIPRRSFRDSITLGAGCLIGAGAFLGTLYLNGDLDALIYEYTRHTGTNVTSGRAQRLIDFSHFDGLRDDRSLQLLMVASVLLAAAAWWTRRKPADGIGRLLVFIAVTPVWMAAALSVVYKLPLYYSWFVFLPVTVAFAAAWDRTPLPRLYRFAVLGVLVLSAIVGLPGRVATTLATWKQRDPQAVTDFVHKHVGERETVLTAYESYYALQGHRGIVYFIEHAMTIGKSGWEGVDVCILDPRSTSSPDVAVEGWHVVDTLNTSGLPYEQARKFGKPYYLLQVWRKK